MLWSIRMVYEGDAHSADSHKHANSNWNINLVGPLEACKFVNNIGWSKGKTKQKKLLLWLQ